MPTQQFPAPTNVTTTHNGPRFPVVNNRVTPTDASKYTQRTDRCSVETYYDDPLVSYARLYEAATAEVGGKGLVVRSAAGSKTFAGTITYPPGPGQYYFNPNMGLLFFNNTDNGEQVLISYTARGSIISAEEINWLWNEVVNVGTPWREQVYELPGNTNRDIQELIVLTVYEVTATGEYIINPPDVEVRLFNPDSASLYYSRLHNKADETRKFKIRGIKKMIAER